MIRPLLALPRLFVYMAHVHLALPAFVVQLEVPKRINAKRLIGCILPWAVTGLTHTTQAHYRDTMPTILLEKLPGPPVGIGSRARRQDARCCSRCG